MTEIKAAITGVAVYVPEDVLTNADLAKIVDTNDEWIRSRTGIEKRHILKGEGLGTSDMAVKAIEKLFQKTGTNPEEIDLIICGTVTSDYNFPSTANVISDNLYSLVDSEIHQLLI